MNSQLAIINKFYQNFKDSIYNVVPATHQNQLVNFQKTVFGDNAYQQSEKFNNWLLKERPLNQRYYCVQGDQVVGQQSAIGIKIKLNNEYINAAYAVDLRVRDEWKMKGLGVAMIGSLMDKYDIIIGMGVSDAAYKMFTRQGWLDLGSVDALVKPLNMSGLKHYNKLDFSSRLNYIAALTLSKLSNFYRNVIHCNKGEFRKVSYFTEAHEILVDDIYGPDAIKIKKEKDYLNWRFINFPDKHHYDVYELIKNKNPVAFFIVKIANMSGHDVLIISEIHAIKSDLPKIVDQIVKLAISKQSCKIIYSGLDDNLKEVLKSRGFFKRPYGDKLLVFTKKNELEPQLINKKNWRICNADSDAEFCLLNNLS